MKQYGFIGLGIMGTAMSRNLITAGYPVTVWNRNPAKTGELADLGATVAHSPAEVAARCDITFAMLSDPAAARVICFGTDGVLAGITTGKGYVDFSTVDAETSREIAAAITARGGRFLEAPVSGSKKPAEDGTLIILTAGDRSLFDESLPCLEKLGKKLLYLGEVGNGARMKIVVNMIMGGMMAAFCEGLALGEKAELNRADILDILDSGALANPMFRLKGAGILAGNYATAFPLKHMQKDLRLAIDLGDRLNQPLPCAATVNELFKEAGKEGYGDEDFSALYKVVQ
jgi:3-hydroxyisobutyrate dehydrogenase-like beta-hydroxyacid dehydrogenase